MISSMEFQANIDKAINSDIKNINSSDDKLIVEYSDGIEFIYTINILKPEIKSSIFGPENILKDKLDDLVGACITKLSSNEIKDVVEELINNGSARLYDKENVFEIEYSGESVIFVVK